MNNFDQRKANQPVSAIVTRLWWGGRPKRLGGRGVVGPWSDYLECLKSLVPIGFHGRWCLFWIDFLKNIKSHFKGLVCVAQRRLS
jgi:hypothetical protein